MISLPDAPLSLPATLQLLRQWEFPRKLGVCDRLFGRMLAAGGICWVRTAPGPVWKLDLANQTHRWIVYGWYEGPAFWRWFERHGASMRTIVDSGANIGQTVLYFSALVPNARVIAYEPGAFARAWLAEGVAANRFGNVSIEATGLGAACGFARLAAEGAADRHGSWNKVSSTEGEPITIATLDDELVRLGIERLDLWKLDMEGYELQALRGAAGALAAGRIRYVYIEAAGEAGKETLALLAGHGYRVHALSNSGRLVAWNTSQRYENALCLAPGVTA
jgi:FkbM family methyltransferase